MFFSFYILRKNTVCLISAEVYIARLQSGRVSINCALLEFSEVLRECVTRAKRKNGDKKRNSNFSRSCHRGFAHDPDGNRYGRSRQIDRPGSPPGSEETPEQRRVLSCFAPSEPAFPVPWFQAAICPAHKNHTGTRRHPLPRQIGWSNVRSWSRLLALHQAKWIASYPDDGY